MKTKPTKRIYLDSSATTVVENHGRMLGRERAGGDQIPGTHVYLRTRTLSKAAMAYAFDTLLEWNGLKVVLVADKTFKVVRVPVTTIP